jgi:hypothetical protein
MLAGIIPAHDRDRLTMLLDLLYTQEAVNYLTTGSRQEIDDSELNYC